MQLEHAASRPYILRQVLYRDVVLRKQWFFEMFDVFYSQHLLHLKIVKQCSPLRLFWC